MALTKRKAKKILRHGTIRGRKLTKAQRGYFGAIAGGQKLRGPQAKKRRLRGRR